MQDKKITKNELERLANLINETPIKKKKDAEYISLIDATVFKIKESLSIINHEIIKDIVSSINDEHLIYILSRDFFKPASDRNNFLIQFINTTIIQKTIEHLYYKKSVYGVRLNDYFGVQLVSKFMASTNKTSRKNNHNPFDDLYLEKTSNSKSIKSNIINELNNKLAYQNADNERLKDQTDLLRKQLQELTTSYEKIEHQLNDKFKEEVKNTLGEFVSGAITELRDNETKYNNRSRFWLTGGSIISALIVLTACYLVFSMNAYMDLNVNRDLSWPTLFYYIGKGLIVLSSLTALAFYCFKQSNAYVHESLKQGERVHAIRFGELCLNLYGNKIDENQIKAVFEDWNINSSTAFLKPEKNETLDIPSNISNIIKSTIESVGKNKI
ncbi:hypothetical protein [Klebsiella variicola]|uniref:hypothetical protein n=1 Tax=Klebsiella variicola TaxID=244366 RepID=UPI00049EF0B7|nr:hypothetical protein [Klebsiella variicola]KDL60599.1 hypothetical protein AD94_01775 [Klebsiella variicola]